MATQEYVDLVHDADACYALGEQLGVLEAYRFVDHMWNTTADDGTCWRDGVSDTLITIAELLTSFDEDGPDESIEHEDVDWDPSPIAAAYAEIVEQGRPVGRRNAVEHVQAWYDDQPKPEDVDEDTDPADQADYLRGVTDALDALTQRFHL